MTTRLLTLFTGLALLATLIFIMVTAVLAFSGKRACDERGGVLYDYRIMACYAPDGRRI